MRKVRCRRRSICCKPRAPCRRNPQSIQLRYLQTLTDVAGNGTHTIVFPLPMDLIQTLLERKGGSGGGD